MSHRQEGRGGGREVAQQCRTLLYNATQYRCVWCVSTQYVVKWQLFLLGNFGTGPSVLFQGSFVHSDSLCS